MDKVKTQSTHENSVEGLAASILKEVIKAEISMHDQQIKAWQWMAQNRPYSSFMDKDVLQGISDSKYLAMEEVKFSFHLKPVSRNFLNRVKLAFGILRGKGVIQDSGFTYEYCNDLHPKAKKIEILITRNSDGSFKSSVSRNKAIINN